MENLFEENEIVYNDAELDTKHTEIVNQCIDSFDSRAKGSDKLKDKNRSALTTELNWRINSYRLVNLRLANRITREEFERNLREAEQRIAELDELLRNTPINVERHRDRYQFLSAIVQGVSTLGSAAIQTYGRH